MPVTLHPFWTNTSMTLTQTRALDMTFLALFGDAMFAMAMYVESTTANISFGETLG